jgi:signal transduction histidine kinase
MALHKDYEGARKQFQKAFNKKQRELDNYLNQLSTFPNVDTIQYVKHPFYTHVYIHDSLAYWSTNKLPSPQFANFHFPSEGILHLQNGWYYSKFITKDSVKIAVSFLIRSQYAYENKYLRNDFDASLNFPYKGFVSLEKEGSLPIFDQGNFVFDIVPYAIQNIKSYYSDAIFALLILTLFFFLNTLLLVLKKKSAFVKLVVAMLLLWIRYQSIHGNWFSFYNELTAFQSTLYASSTLFPSFADLWLNVLVAIGVLKIIFQIFFPKTEDVVKHTQVRTWASILVLASILIVNDFLFRGIIENSSISLEVNKLFSLNFYSFFALTIVGFIFFEFAVLFRQFINFSLEKEMPSYLRKIQTLTLILIYVSFNLYVNNPIKVWGFNCLIIVLYLLICERNKKELPNYSIIIILFFFSIQSFNTLQNYLSKKERQERQLLANQLASDQDISTEIEYSTIQPSLQYDGYLVKLLRDDKTISPSSFQQNLENRYFNGFWEQYEVSFYLFNKKGQPLLNFSNNQNASIRFLDKVISNNSIPSEIDKNIYFIKNFTSQFAYIIKQRIEDATGFQGFLYVALKTKKIPENIGYPRLLISSKSKIFDVLENYSVAKYYNKRLVYNYGHFTYPSVNDNLIHLIDGKTEGFFNVRNYNHFVYKRTDMDMIVISRPSHSTFHFLTSFSYLFCFYGLLLLIPFSEKIIFQRKWKILPTLALRIQILLLGIVLITLVAYGIGSGIFIQRQYNEITNQHIKDKLTSIVVDLNSLYDQDTTVFDFHSGDLLDIRLQNLSRVFSTDITLFSPNGYLLASSRLKVFNSGLVSEQMNAHAMKHMNEYNNSEYVHDENIGNLSYTSGYAPIFNADDDKKAFVNLQQFGQQEQYELQIENFLVSILNIFILLLAFTTMFTLIISNWITMPLKKLQVSIENIRFGKYNQPISYQGKDEIGELVSKYNEKLQELEYTAQQLAHSERENAWKEMAKQVAHEIKNPLTPMKLRLQHFQRIFDSQESIDKNQVTNIVNSMVEQIDTLAKIANEFSSFAKMPKSNSNLVDLVKVIQNVKEIFQSTVDTEIEFFHAKRECLVLGDKDLLLRVFNNLIQNALQAIPENRVPKVSILLQKQENEWVINITDNGVGISMENQEKLFTPYFTTKTKGTGLGLAMVKQIIDMHEGKITYETSAKGTTFTIVLKVYNEVVS